MLARLLSTHFWLPALACFAAGLWLPGDYTALRPFIPVVLGGILFFSCLKLRLSDVLAVASARAALARLGLITGVRLLALPVVVAAITAVLAPRWQSGLVLIAAMPAGLSCVAFADLYRGNVALALVAVLATCLLAPLTVPGLLHVLGTGAASVATAELAARGAYLAILLLAPFALAQVVRRLAPALIQRHHASWNHGAVACSCLLVFVSIAANRAAFHATAPGDALVALGLVSGCCALGATGAWALRRRLGHADAVTTTLCWLFPNNGLAIAFASRFFPGSAEALLPAILIQIPIIAGTALYGAWALRASAARSTGDGG